MKSAKKIIPAGLLLSALLLGCLPITGKNRATDFSTEGLSQKEFAFRIRKLQNDYLTLDEKEGPDAVRIHQDLVSLFLSPHNPDRDLGRAATELEEIISLSPQGPERDEAKSILTILNEFTEQRRVIETLQAQLDEAQSARESQGAKDRRIKELTAENTSLKQRQEELRAENRKLETTIEKLKFLDLNIEKKRKNFR
ncbi:MAG: hypothetical protein KKG47_10550 [Proteobacteria bacterium]|nr:hypothetical protein [Pseudomonadota bacterium]MBU1737583.1 hypothetical protein [Pseudomonadota bacterium]